MNDEDLKDAFKKVGTPIPTYKEPVIDVIKDLTVLNDIISP